VIIPAQQDGSGHYQLEGQVQETAIRPEIFDHKIGVPEYRYNQQKQTERRRVF
jgi:hypothetical protein